MGRRKIIVRTITPDHVYHDVLIAQLINKVMISGNKSLARRIVYKALEVVAENGSNPLTTLHQAINNLQPQMEVRYKKVGGSTCAVPRRPNQRRRLYYALSWLVNDMRSGRTAIDGLAKAILAAANNEGAGITARDQQNKLADANKAYAGLNW